MRSKSCPPPHRKQHFYESKLIEEAIKGLDNAKSIKQCRQVMEIFLIKMKIFLNEKKFLKEGYQNYKVPSFQLALKLRPAKIEWSIEDQYDITHGLFNKEK